MDIIQKHDSGVAVEDIQRRLCALEYLRESDVTGVFDDATAQAVQAFCANNNLEVTEEVNARVWAKLVDASFEFGSRSLYLRIPYFHGRDVVILQQALSALGFSCGGIDGIFGAHTEDALRRFQLNMGLPSDGIVGAFTYQALKNLQHSWKGKDSFSPVAHLGFARAADVLENNFLCLFGTTEFTRLVASRVSNLALATNSSSKVASAESLLVEPDASTLFVQIIMPGDAAPSNIPVVDFSPDESLAFRLEQAMSACPNRIAVRLPELSWNGAGEERSAQHYAIVLLDALCLALINATESA